MELIEIIKHTIFLIILLVFGIFSLSYSIYKIRTRNKVEQAPQTITRTKPVKVQKIEIPKSILLNHENDRKRKTSERFTVINDLQSDSNSKCSEKKINKSLYTLQSIGKTDMYTLKFR
ncbi:MAG: hypothetical protein MUO34_08470 [Ignavibacteriaceae bacterium]|nr:hypothetical protein [Ignavibacteriaceae bacterium]